MSAITAPRGGFLPATRFYAFPREHSRRISIDERRERLHGEIKRRIRSVGAFPDRESALRLITAVALQATCLSSSHCLDISLLRRRPDRTRLHVK